MRKRTGIFASLALAACMAASVPKGVYGAEAEFGEDMLVWDGTVYAGDSTKTYAIPNPKGSWKTIDEGACGGDFYVDGNTLYFLQSDGTKGAVKSIKKNGAKAETVVKVGEDARLVGKVDSYLYYLEQDPGSDWMDGRTMYEYNLSSGKKTAVASGVGKAGIFDQVIVMAGMATDVSPVPMYMVDINGDVGLVSEHASPDFYTGPEGFYYVEYGMKGEAWDSVSLAAIGAKGRRTVISKAGKSGTMGIVGISDGTAYISYAKSAGADSVLLAVELETGECYEMDRPDMDGNLIPMLFLDGDQKCWYSGGTMYYWRGAGYHELAALPKGSVPIGMKDGWIYYWKMDKGKKTLAATMK